MFWDIIQQNNITNLIYPLEFSRQSFHCVLLDIWILYATLSFVRGCFSIILKIKEQRHHITDMLCTKWKTALWVTRSRFWWATSDRGFETGHGSIEAITLGIWNTIVQKHKLEREICVLRWLAYDSKFKPGVYDNNNNNNTRRHNSNVYSYRKWWAHELPRSKDQIWSWK